MMHNPLLISVQRIVDSEQRTESSLLTHKLQRYVFFRTFCANQMQKACFLLRSAKFVEHLRKPSAMMLAPIADAAYFNKNKRFLLLKMFFLCQNLVWCDFYCTFVF